MTAAQPYQIQPPFVQETEARAFADLADMASKGMFRDMLGYRWRYVLTQMYLQAFNDNSHHYVLFARQGDQILGMISGYHAQDKRAHARHNSFLYLRYALWQAPRVLLYLVAMSVLMRFKDHVPHGAFYLQYMAIYPQHRRRRISHALLGAMEERARSQSANCLLLDVDRHNAAAIASYEAYGFEMYRSSPVLLFNGTEQGVHRMIKSL